MKTYKSEEVDIIGTQIVYKNILGLLHREDGPAVECQGGHKQWWLNGIRHREDGPAYEHTTGSKEWWLNGKLHREDGPAIEGSQCYEAWWVNGQRHRADGPAIVYNNGHKEWYICDYRHREDGPAIEKEDGTKIWYFEGKLHREDGPAFEPADGDSVYFLNDEEIPEEEWDERLEDYKHNGIKYRVNAFPGSPDQNYSIVYNDGRREHYNAAGLLHGERQAAVFYSDGTKEYWLNGKQISEEDYHELSWKVKPYHTGYKIDCIYYVDMEGRGHRTDGPCYVNNNGAKEWRIHGQLHREDGPAIENGVCHTTEWYIKGKKHRDDGPAVEWKNGIREWWSNGQRHREDGPAIELGDDRGTWYLNGNLHREGGPAVVDVNGTKSWYLNGNLHRIDGPAVEYPKNQWKLNGESIEPHDARWSKLLLDATLASLTLCCTALLSNSSQEEQSIIETADECVQEIEKIEAIVLNT